MVDFGHQHLDVRFGAFAFGNIADVALDDGTIVFLIKVGYDLDLLLPAADAFKRQVFVANLPRPLQLGDHVLARGFVLEQPDLEQFLADERVVRIAQHLRHEGIGVDYFQGRRIDDKYPVVRRLEKAAIAYLRHLHPGLVPLALGDVADDGQPARYPTVGIPQDRHAGFDVQFAPVAPDMGAFAPPFAVLAQCGFGFRLILRAGPSPLIDLSQGPSQRFGRGETIESFGRGIEIDDTLIAIDRDHGVADLRQHFTAKPHGFGVQPLKRIDLRADDALHHQGIDFVATDSAERFLGFQQTRVQRRVFGQQGGSRWRFHA